MPESFDEQLSRLDEMGNDDPPWDLSPNDRAAIRAVLKELTRFRRDYAEMEEFAPPDMDRREFVRQCLEGWETEFNYGY